MIVRIYYQGISWGAGLALWSLIGLLFPCHCPFPLPRPPTVSERSWAEWRGRYGEERVNEVGSWAKEVQPKNPAGWMKKCLEEEWPKPPELAQKERKLESLQREQRDREAEAREEQRLADIREKEVGEVMGWWYGLTAGDQDKLRGQIDSQTLRNEGLNDMVAKAALMSLLRDGQEAPGITWLRVAKAVWEKEHGKWLTQCSFGGAGEVQLNT